MGTVYWHGCDGLVEAVHIAGGPSDGAGVGLSVSSTMSTKLRASVGTSANRSGGDTLPPSAVKRGGIDAFSAKASLEIRRISGALSPARA